MPDIFQIFIHCVLIRASENIVIRFFTLHYYSIYCSLGNFYYIIIIIIIIVYIFISYILHKIFVCYVIKRKYIADILSNL